MIDTAKVKGPRRGLGKNFVSVFVTVCFSADGCQCVHVTVCKTITGAFLYALNT